MQVLRGNQDEPTPDGTRRLGEAGKPQDVPAPGEPAPAADAGPGPTALWKALLGGHDPATQPERIGPYRILGVLGEGGMGVVYAAEQESPIRRRVALKVIKLGMDTREVVARFEAERQALALMSHPNIARVLDGGATPDGRPFFVMEEVQGLPLTQYCDRHRLGLKERLGLFLQVCRAVEHAHHRGVIHRDLKPSNILVSSPDEEPVAKIIDFGVAKAINQRLTEKTIYTGLGRAVGTPAYMSPEQAEMSAEQVDGRTDIYSLGVILYELLVGELPLDWEVLSKAAYDEIVRRIREEEPPTPSTRWLRLNPETTKAMAEKRRAAAAAFARELRGDLDWVTMKAIEKERTRRYGTASELAADVERYLREEPVTAGPPSGLYRLRKFGRKNRGPVLAVGAVILALLLGLVVSIVLYGVSESNRRLATENRDLAVKKEGEAKASEGRALKSEKTALEKEALAKAQLEEILRLSDLTDLKAYEREAEKLWPASSSMVAPMEAWLEKARVLAERVVDHRLTLETLRKRALPPTDEEAREDRETHPRAGELAGLKEARAKIEAEVAKLEGEPGVGGTWKLAAGATILSFGADEEKKHPTYYFRTSFEVEAPEKFASIGLSLLVDDGAAVYLNGKEVLRENLPEGSLTYETLAAKALGDEAEEPRTFERKLSEAEGSLIRGKNTLAAEVHQATRDSSDLRFDLEVIGRQEGGEAMTLLSKGSVWRYDDRGEDLGEAWRQPGFDDASWKAGPGPFGYGFLRGPGRLAELGAEDLKLAERISGLEEEVSVRRTWTFSGTRDRWWHDTLEALVTGLEAFRNPDPFKGPIAGVEKRLEFAKGVRKRTIEDAKALWDEAMASIRDEKECPQYRGLVLKPQEGLLPLGRDPGSGLWEFVHVQTGDPPLLGPDGKPVRDAEGRLVLSEETGIVFVLIPEGTVRMGAERATLGVEGAPQDGGGLRVERVLEGSLASRLGLQVGDVVLSVNGARVGSSEEILAALEPLATGDAVALQVARGGGEVALSGELGPNVDPAASRDDGPVHEVALGPFFFSKFEMTQGQWLRFTGESPSYYGPKRRFGGKQHNLRHPVEQVSWEQCAETLARLGLALPTEAQWEYAARAGTGTVWWTGSRKESLRGAVNLADAFCKRTGGPDHWQYEEWLDDGYTAHAPVGSFRPNVFGLHDTVGNVWEWCRDAYGPYDLSVRPGDGERCVPAAAGNRVYRGGSFNEAASVARSALRAGSAPSIRFNLLGLRPARVLP